MDVKLQPWSEGDLPLLEKLLGDPRTMEHLGGPESLEKINQRHQRYLHLPEPDHMFKVVLSSTYESVGSIGYWEKTWREQLVYETGWHILPDYQGQGMATKAGRLLIELARIENRHRFLHAFPGVDNAASNSICSKLGFTLIESHDFEYPPGHIMRCNDWRLELF